MTSARLVADYIIRNNDTMFTAYQLIKLIYFAHGFHLALTGKPLIRDRIEAWKYGPTIPSLHHELEVFEGAPIEVSHEISNEAILPKQREIIDKITEVYGKFSPDHLQRAVLMAKSPWDECYDGEPHTEIPDSIIRTYYRAVLDI